SLGEWRERIERERSERLASQRDLDPAGARARAAGADRYAHVGAVAADHGARCIERDDRCVALWLMREHDDTRATRKRRSRVGIVDLAIGDDGNRVSCAERP